MLRVHYNHKPATIADLAPLAFAGFAHFTAMQTRGRAVRGLELHLARLRSASDELFGTHLPDGEVRAALAAAIDAGPADASLACYISSRPGEFTHSPQTPDLDILVKIDAPASAPEGPLALDVVRHERYLPRIKHVGEAAKTHLLRCASRRGFDDVAFLDARGRLSEASIWNLAFWDGRRVLWPDAALLPGVTMQVVQRQLDRAGIDQQTRAIGLQDINTSLQAVVMNSWTPAVAVSRLGDRELDAGDDLVRMLHSAYEREPRTPVRT
ncbi:MAG: aminotransferase class IV [Actinomycetaceae bacterium]|nr:aminotransferase class IV [Actinomycetaceae bacterium]